MITTELYRSYNRYLRARYGTRVHKVSLDAGFTCPNRDGTKAVGGCIYCNNDSFNFSPAAPVREQLAAGIEKSKRRFKAGKFIAYFQAYTNTYADPSSLREIYSAVYDFPEVVGLSIGTRPDCVSEEVLRVIEEFVPTHEVWVEYGLESSSNETLRKINRAHTFEDFEDAVQRTAGRGIKIATHIIIGFPWESREDVFRTATAIAALPIDGIKIHHLHIVKGTPLENIYEKAPFPLLSLEEYSTLAAEVLKILPPDIIVMRLTGECPEDLLMAPDWTNRKADILAAINESMSR